MAQIKAKFQINAIEGSLVRATASKEGEDNASWSDGEANGTLSLQVTNAEAASNFKVNDNIYATFSSTKTGK